MPIFNRGHRPAHWPARPVRPVRTEVAPRASRMEQVWPAVTALTAVFVFIVFWAQATLMLALIMALAILVAGWTLVTLVSGTGWITRLRLRIADLRR